MRTKITVLLIIISLFICRTPSLLASEPNDLMDLSMEDLMTMVTTASKKSEKIEDAPSVITVISQKEIKGYSAKNLGEVLNRVVGAIFLSANCFTDNVVSFRAQSTTPYNNHILILLNGRPIRDPGTGGLNCSVYDTFPLDAIDHIEIILGPGSVLYGSCAFSGVINIKTKIQKDNGLKSEISISARSYNGYNESITAGLKKNDLETYFAFSHFRDEGQEFEFTDGLQTNLEKVPHSELHSKKDE